MEGTASARRREKRARLKAFLTSSDERSSEREVFSSISREHVASSGFPSRSDSSSGFFPSTDLSPSEPCSPCSMASLGRETSECEETRHAMGSESGYLSSSSSEGVSEFSELPTNAARRGSSRPRSIGRAHDKDSSLNSGKHSAEQHPTDGLDHHTLSDNVSHGSPRSIRTPEERNAAKLEHAIAEATKEQLTFSPHIVELPEMYHQRRARTHSSPLPQSSPLSQSSPLPHSSPLSHSSPLPQHQAARRSHAANASIVSDNHALSEDGAPEMLDSSPHSLLSHSFSMPPRANANSGHGRSKGSSFHDRVMAWQRRINNRVRDLADAEDRKQSKECSFAPRILQRSRSVALAMGKAKTAYRSSVVSLIVESRERDLKQSCTFAPKINPKSRQLAEKYRRVSYNHHHGHTHSPSRDTHIAGTAPHVAVSHKHGRGLGHHQHSPARGMLYGSDGVAAGKSPPRALAGATPASVVASLQGDACSVNDGDETASACATDTQSIASGFSVASNSSACSAECSCGVGAGGGMVPLEFLSQEERELAEASFAPAVNKVSGRMKRVSKYLESDVASRLCEKSPFIAKKKKKAGPGRPNTAPAKRSEKDLEGGWKDFLSRDAKFKRRLNIKHKLLAMKQANKSRPELNDRTVLMAQRRGRSFHERMTVHLKTRRVETQKIARDAQKECPFRPELCPKSHSIVARAPHDDSGKVVIRRRPTDFDKDLTFNPKIKQPKRKISAQLSSYLGKSPTERLAAGEAPFATRRGKLHAVHEEETRESGEDASELIPLRSPAKHEKSPAMAEKVPPAGSGKERPAEHVKAESSANIPAKTMSPQPQQLKDAIHPMREVMKQMMKQKRKGGDNFNGGGADGDGADPTHGDSAASESPATIPGSARSSKQDVGAVEAQEKKLIHALVPRVRVPSLHGELLLGGSE